MTGPADVQVRPATAGDGPALRALEVRAGQAFATIGMDDVAADHPPSLEVLAGHAADGRSAVAVDPATGAVVGHVLVDRIDDAAHLEQVSVDPDHQGGGIGRRLLDWAAGWAGTEGRSALTLTTFRHVPWNAPLHAHLGFREPAPDEVGPGLATVIARSPPTASTPPRASPCARTSDSASLARCARSVRSEPKGLAPLAPL